jgi:hypothetical protein
MALPENHEALTANAALEFRVSFRLAAIHLHLSDPNSCCFNHYDCDGSSSSERLPIPLRGRRRDLWWQKRIDLPVTEAGYLLAYDQVTGSLDSASFSHYS